jgi:enamine deaminase RidA (YjgF/YER057c/UK114 family)
MIQRFETSARMSKIGTHNGAAYLCGEVGAGDTVTEQTKDCLSRVEALLAQAGSSPDRLLQAIIWLSGMNDFDEMNLVWDAWIPHGQAPRSRMRRSTTCARRAQSGNHRNSGVCLGDLVEQRP